MNLFDVLKPTWRFLLYECSYEGCHGRATETVTVVLSDAHFSEQMVFRVCRRHTHLGHGTYTQGWYSSLTL